MQVVYTRGVSRARPHSPPLPTSQCAVRTRDKRAAAAPPPLGTLIRKRTNKKTQVPRRPLRRPVEEDAGRQEEERTIPASRGAAAPSRHRRDSYPSDEVVGGFFSILRPFGPRRATAMLRAGRRQQAQVPQGRGPGRRRQGVPRGSREEADFLPRRRRQQPRLRHGPQVGQGQVRRVHEGGLRRVARQGRQEAAEPDVLSARCARRAKTCSAKRANRQARWRAGGETRARQRRWGLDGVARSVRVDGRRRSPMLRPRCAHRDRRRGRERTFRKRSNLLYGTPTFDVSFKKRALAGPQRPFKSLTA